MKLSKLDSAMTKYNILLQAGVRGKKIDPSMSGRKDGATDSRFSANLDTDMNV